jgi:hypothetical protein
LSAPSVCFIASVVLSLARGRGLCYSLAPNGMILWSLYFPPNDDGTPVWIDTSPLIVSDGVMLMLDSADILHAYIEPACQVCLPLVGK